MLLERFHFFLKKKNEFGQVVYDKGDSCYKHIYEEHKESMKKGSSWGWEYDRINNIYEKDDEECRALQTADLVAHSVWSCFNRNDFRHYNRCLPFFNAGPNGQIEGYGVKILA